MECDVLIVGGGPAGSAAAYFLRDKGLDVILVERLGDQQFDRYHSICGAGVNKIAVKNIDLRKEEILNDVDVLRITWPNENKIDLKIKGYVIDRPKVFHRMREQAVASGIRFIKGSVKSVEQNDSQITCLMLDGSEIRSKYLIGADGAYSTVRKNIFGSTPEIMLKVEEYHSGAYAEPNILDFQILETCGFYQWYFPYKGGRCSGSVLGYAADEPDSTKGVRTIPLGYVDEIVKGNVFLIGDAAGLPNPMTAGGLRTAFQSAESAVNAILSGNPMKYQSWWKHSRMSDKRFMKAHEEIASYTREELDRFSKYMIHKGLWTNGFHSVIHNPRKTWMYIGCLMSLKYGW